jgi:SAM-dependent methyltransferase
VRVSGFDPVGSFDAEVAAGYDDEPRGDEADAAAFLARRAGDGGALEFAIGTGRIALPVAALGATVDGIELSHHMAARLRTKPGGAAIDVFPGDMAEVRTGRRYALAYLVFNTIFNLPDQEAQVRLFENAERHLADGGVFVVEAAVPSAWIPADQEQAVRADRVDATAIAFDTYRYDPATQVLLENHLHITADGIRFGPIRLRLAWPAELDLMARLAGLRLLERHGGWRGEPFTGTGLHVSVYGR